MTCRSVFVRGGRKYLWYTEDKVYGHCVSQTEARICPLPPRRPRRKEHTTLLLLEKLEDITKSSPVVETEQSGNASLSVFCILTGCLRWWHSWNVIRSNEAAWRYALWRKERPPAPWRKIELVCPLWARHKNIHSSVSLLSHSLTSLCRRASSSLVQWGRTERRVRYFHLNTSLQIFISNHFLGWSHIRRRAVPLEGSWEG